MLASVPDFSSSHSTDLERFFPAFCLALILHAALIMLLWPWTKHTESGAGAPVRIVVEMAQMVEQSPQPETEHLIEPKPEPITEPLATESEQAAAKAPETEQPILTAKEDTPLEPEDMLVPEQVEKVAEEVAQTVQAQPEPEKIEQPKPEPKVVKPEQPVTKPQQDPKPVVTAKAKPTEHNQAITTKEVTTPTPSATHSNSDISSTQASAGQSRNTNETDSNVQSEEVDQNEAWKGYGQLLYAMVSKNKTYPQIAIRRQLEGVVLVSARFKQGELVELEILEPGSGHTILDKAARTMLEKAVKQLPVRGDLSKKSFTVVVPVDFRLTG